MNELIKKEETGVVKKEKEEEKTAAYDLQELMDNFGSIKLTDEQKEILFAKPNDEEIEIRPDGLIYAPWTSYSKRMRQAFGMEWGLVKGGEPKLVGELVVVPYFLVIQGKPVAMAMGECRYSSRNQTMSWGDAIEGARSNALSRSLKTWMFTELWEKRFGERWKGENAMLITKVIDGKLKEIWVRKDSKDAQEFLEAKKKKEAKGNGN